MLEISPVDTEPTPTSFSLRITKNRDNQTQKWLLVDQDNREFETGPNLESDRKVIEDLLLAQLEKDGITAQMEIIENGQIMEDKMKFLAHKSGIDGVMIELVVPGHEEEPLCLISYNPRAGSVASSVQWLETQDSTHENKGWAIIGTSLLILILRKNGVLNFLTSTTLSNFSLVPAVMSALKTIDIVSGQNFSAKVDYSQSVVVNLDLETIIDPKIQRLLITSVLDCLQDVDPTNPRSEQVSECLIKLNQNQDLNSLIAQGTRKI